MTYQSNPSCPSCLSCPSRPSSPSRRSCLARAVFMRRRFSSSGGFIVCHFVARSCASATRNVVASVVQPSGDHQHQRRVGNEAGADGDRRMPRQVGQGPRLGLSFVEDSRNVGSPTSALSISAHQQRPAALGADVLDRRNEARSAEGVRPVAGALVGELIDAAAARDIVERRRRFRAQDEAERGWRDSGSVIGSSFAPASRSTSSASLSILRRSSARRRGIFRIRRATAPATTTSADPGRSNSASMTRSSNSRAARGIPIERRVECRHVVAVGTVDGVQHESRSPPRRHIGPILSMVQLRPIAP